jgi:L-asparaginase II
MDSAHTSLDPVVPPSAGRRPVNPVLARVWRGEHVESQHRGVWALVDTAGTVLEAAGGVEHPVFARSSVKSLQALPLIESGAAERFGFGDDELALALASHNAESCHTDRVAALLERLGLGPEALQCGPQPPGDKATRLALARSGGRPSPIHNNCSGKHAGFLALALHLGVDPADYLDPESASQVQVRRAVTEVTDARDGELTAAVDGCSAPTFRLPLTRLATGIARVANPDGLAAERRAACRRMADAVAAWPELIAGSHERLCTDLARVTGGRLFPKLGGEAVYLVGIRGADRGLALKVDDGHLRGMNATVVALLERFGFLSADEVAALDSWRRPVLKNWAGREVGHIEVTA